MFKTVKTCQKFKKKRWKTWLVLITNSTARGILQAGSLFCHLTNSVKATSGYATMVHGRGCNPHRCTTTFTNLEITSLWRHWWRHNSETIRDREKRRPPRHAKSSELANGENRIALQLLQNRKWRHWWRHNLGSIWKLQKRLQRILVSVRSTI